MATHDEAVKKAIEENAKAAGVREAELHGALGAGALLGLAYKGKDYTSEAITLRGFRFTAINGRDVEVIERAPNEWHLLIWNRGMLEDHLGLHRDPTVLLGEVQPLLGQARVHRGAMALDLIRTFGAVIQDAIAMQTGIK